MNKETGGLAFLNDLNQIEQRSNITLRDWFAGKAMAGVISNSNTRKIERNELEPYTRFCYEWADAMLKARGQ